MKVYNSKPLLFMQQRSQVGSSSVRGSRSSLEGSLEFSRCGRVFTLFCVCVLSLSLFSLSTFAILARIPLAAAHQMQRLELPNWDFVHRKEQKQSEKNLSSYFVHTGCQQFQVKRETRGEQRTAGCGGRVVFFCPVITAIGKAKEWGVLFCCFSVFE